MQRSEPIRPIDRRVILVGAGNAHLVFVRRWAMRPVPGVAVTLVNDSATVSYSAMTSGLIAGEYQPDEIEIDLVQLCARASVRLIAEPVIGLDSDSRTLQFANRPAVAYEIASLGLGAVPMPPPGAESLRWSFQLRPLKSLISGLFELERELRLAPRPFRFVVVGGGSSGCELALAVRRRFAQCPGFSLSLVHAGERLTPNFPSKVSHVFAEELGKQGCPVHLNARVTAAEGNRLMLDHGDPIPADGVLWAIDPSPPPVLHSSPLARNEQGFLLVRETLQSLSDSSVFGSGDCVAFPAFPDLPRNGVMAVRQGKRLFANITALLRGRPLQPFQPQRRWLSLLNTCNGSAVASYGGLTASGTWARRWKERIDRRWMSRFQSPPPTSIATDDSMRCGGCGSKVPGDVLAGVLKRLDVLDDARIVMGLSTGEDAAVFRTADPGTVEVQTVDHFRSFINDPFLFGRVAALHSISDLYAMNARPFSALAIATVPVARGRIQSEQLHEMLAGAALVFRELGVALAGGHTTEGQELALGFAATGYARVDRLFRKGALKPGDVLVLTKPLGTGALLAAWMRGWCRAGWFEAAVQTMLQSNRAAAELFDAAGVLACTDVTGFGLAGHLLEMLDASRASARLRAHAVPVLPGFDQLAGAGVVSSLQEANSRCGCRIASAKPLEAWLFDPQTSGGLLAGVRPEKVDALLEQLRDSGAVAARAIGEVLPLESLEPVIALD
jgi:selenide,water dikinase